MDGIKELNGILKKLRRTLIDNNEKDTVSVKLFLNSEGFEIEVNRRTKDSLIADGISMKNINGDFIK